jgi:5,10-methylenetetrahydromethanopterin reductase
VEIGFFFWPYSIELVRAMADAAERHGYDMIGIADTPGNAIDPWIAATLAAERLRRARIALCVSNLASRAPAVSAAAIASLDLLAPGRAVLGIGAGHSGTTNIGLARSKGAGEIAEGITLIRALLRGEEVTGPSGRAALPWVKTPSPVFMAASGPHTLRAAGRAADGVFVNFGLLAENQRASEALVRDGAATAGRDPGTLELWQIAGLDCHEDGELARRKIGAILAFMAGGYILAGDLAQRGVPAELHGAVAELRRRYSTRPGEADARLVEELGLFDYLSGRFSIHGTPAACAAQLARAAAAGLERIMFSVSLAADPVRTVELFGASVLPRFRRAPSGIRGG